MADTNRTRILITGAAGTIGSALVEFFLARNHVVCAYDHNEDGLSRLGKAYYEKYGKERLKLFVGDVRDLQRLRYAFDGVDIAIHAAALKHVELSEYNVLDCIETNINGTKNIIHAAISSNVKKVLFTSSDKAVNPSSTMGATKLLGERIVSDANYITGSNKIIFSSIRFGNVLESNGSVLTIFRDCIDNGRPLPVTDLGMTRFFLTIKNAVELVSYALENMKGGEIFIKSMGAASVVTLAQAVADNDDVAINVIGPKPGEKLYEELITKIESERTILKDGVYIILPQAINSSDMSRLHEAEKYVICAKPLTSVDTNLNRQELQRLIKEI